MFPKVRMMVDALAEATGGEDKNGQKTASDVQISFLRSRAR
jgi:hypothetical protein